MIYVYRTWRCRTLWRCSMHRRIAGDWLDPGKKERRISAKDIDLGSESGRRDGRRVGNAVGFSSHLVPDGRIQEWRRRRWQWWPSDIQRYHPRIYCSVKPGRQLGYKLVLCIARLATSRSYTLLPVYMYVYCICIYLHRWPFQRAIRVSYVYVPGSCAAEPCQYWFSI